MWISCVMEKQKKQKKAVIVLGMHRSGTSFLAGVLHQLGVDFGKALMPVLPENEKGFWEDINVNQMNERFLNDSVSSWDDVSERGFGERGGIYELDYQDKLEAYLIEEFKDEILWGVKDPRNCRLLPLWLPVLKKMGVDPYFVMIYRNPIEVEASLKARNEFPESKSYLLWLHHVFSAELETRGYPRLLVNYASAVSDIDTLINGLSNFLSLGLTDSMRLGARRFLSPELKHHCANDDDIYYACSVPICVKHVYASLLQSDSAMENISAAMDVHRLKMNFVGNIFQDNMRWLSEEAVRYRQTLLVKDSAIAGLDATKNTIEVKLRQYKRSLFWRIFKLGFKLEKKLRGATWFNNIKETL
jgi:hypothetical protein